LRLFLFSTPKLKIIKASKLKKSAHYNKILTQSKAAQNVVKLNLVHGIATFKQKISSKKLMDAYERGDYKDVFEVIPWETLPNSLDKYKNSLARGMSSAGLISLDALPVPKDTSLRYDVHNPHITDYLNSRTADLVVDIKDNTKDIIQEQVKRAFTNAQSPRQVANDIKGSIGLYPRLQNAVDNYRTGLVKQGLPGMKIEQLTGSYYDRLLDYRAMTIARTEIRNANNHAQLAVWKNAAEKGYIDDDSARKVWVVDGDPCEICLPMDGEEVELDESWTVEYPDGTEDDVDVPSEAHPNCWCGMELKFEKGTPTDDEDSTETEDQENEDDDSDDDAE
jgi:hypothetical protein